MKKMMILVSAIMMAAAANAKNVETKAFSSVLVDVPSTVRVVYGETYNVDIRVAHDYEANNVRMTVENGVLKIRMVNQDANDEVKPVRITIAAPVVPELKTGQGMVMTTVKQAETARDMADNE